VLIDVACVYLFEMPLNLRVQWRKRVLCSWGQSDLCQSYAEQYRDWGAGGTIAFRLAVERDEKVKKRGETHAFLPLFFTTTPEE